MFLAQHYGCQIVGIDLSTELLSRTRSIFTKENPSARVDFVQGDAESLPFADSTVDIVISECAFSLLPHKDTAASEFSRVLKPGGKLVITDVILRGSQICEELQNQVTFALCIAGAKPLDGYINIFKKAGFTTYCIEDHSEELKKLAYRMLINEGFRKSWLDSPHQSDSRQVLQKLFKQVKPGYALIAMTR